MAGHVFPIMTLQFGSVSKDPFRFISLQQGGHCAFAPFISFQPVPGAGGGSRGFFGRWGFGGGVDGGGEVVVVVK